MIKNYLKKDVKEFLTESNAIESVYGSDSLKEAQEAWDYAFKNKDKFNTPYILEVHRLLAQRLHPSIAGQFRDCDVWIGGDRKPNLTPMGFNNLVNDWCNEFKEQLKNIKDLSREQREKTVQWNHIKIEGIHPHQDFNGRTYRLLMNIQRFLFALPILIIHEGDEQMDYYRWFK